MSEIRSGSGRLLAVDDRALRLVAAVGHELVELGLVLGLAQAVEEIAELLLLFLEALQRLGAVFVEGGIAARAAPRAAPPLIHPAFLLAVPAAATSASHASTPYQVSQEREADRPRDDEGQNQQGDPGRLAHIVHASSEAHRDILSRDVNVNTLT